jgi:hypothetical protein
MLLSWLCQCNILYENALQAIAMNVRSSCMLTKDGGEDRR